MECFIEASGWATLDTGRRSDITSAPLAISDTLANNDGFKMYNWIQYHPIDLISYWSPSSKTNQTITVSCRSLLISSEKLNSSVVNFNDLFKSSVARHNLTRRWLWQIMRNVTGGEQGSSAQLCSLIVTKYHSGYNCPDLSRPGHSGVSIGAGS